MLGQSRRDIADAIVARLREVRADAVTGWSASTPIRHFVVDDLIPEPLAARIGLAFPSHQEMTLKKSLREDKYVSAQMNAHDPLLEEALYAFQEAQVIDEIREITSKPDLEPDPRLYAGGISSMGHQQFLNPHIDNSHDQSRTRWRALNLLWYSTEGWQESWGGNLELWPEGPTARPLTIVSRFNRLVVMETHQRSWHSVSPVRVDQPRRCISNYYFSTVRPTLSNAYHVTSFRGRPEQRARDLVLRADNTIRWVVRTTTGELIFKNRHVYKDHKT
jgi:Rps23 Pro-64 3,4-dihydroxylase Tpa1-like proline 4-hydroxylase